METLLSVANPLLGIAFFRRIFRSMFWVAFLLAVATPSIVLAQSPVGGAAGKGHAAPQSGVARHPGVAAGKTEPAGTTPILVGPMTESFWSTLASAEKLYAAKPVKAVVTPFSAAPVTAQDSRGNFYLWADQDSAHGSNPIYTAFSGGYIVLGSGEHVLIHSETKQDPKWWCHDRQGNVFALDAQSNPQQVGTGKGYEIMPEGSSRMMTRGPDASEPWTGDEGGKIYRLSDSGKLVQAGWAQYMWVVPEASPDSKRLVFMSKAMGPRDKWIGVSCGVIYLEK